MTFHTFMALEGALAVTALACLALCVASYCLWCVYWWRRHVAMVGSEKGAISVVKAGETVFAKPLKGEVR